jgi:hypothetical protein
MENEGKDAEHRVKSEVPNQRHRRTRRIEMLEVPRVFQCEHASEPDRRQRVEQKNCAHAEKQNH